MGYEQALEARFTIHTLVAKHSDVLLETMGPKQKEKDGIFLANIRAGLNEGDVCYWSPEMSRMLKRIADSMPEWTLLPEELPSVSGFVYFADPLPLGKAVQPQVLRAIAYAPSTEYPDGLVLNSWWERPDNRSFLFPGQVGLFWPFGVSNHRREQILPDDDWRDCDLPSRYFAAAMALMDQSIIVKSAQQAPRATRKRLGEVGETPIQVVRLRRAERHEREHDDEKAYELTCQFVVRGYWKQVAYGPAASLRRPQFILPHIKGPEGAPMKVQADRIFVVDR